MPQMPDNAIRVKVLDAHNVLSLTDCMGCSKKYGLWKRYRVMCVLTTDAGQQSVEIPLTSLKELLKAMD